MTETTTKRKILTLNRTKKPAAQPEVVAPVPPKPKKNDKYAEIRANKPKLTEEERIAKLKAGEAKSEENLRLAKEAKQARLDVCRNWLFSTFPALFDHSDIKPFKVGIRADITKVHREAGGTAVLGFGATLPVNRVLNRWVNSWGYLRALTADGAMRHDLNGEPVEAVSPKEVAHAQRLLKKRKPKEQAT